MKSLNVLLRRRSVRSLAAGVLLPVVAVTTASSGAAASPSPPPAAARLQTSALPSSPADVANAAFLAAAAPQLASDWHVSLAEATTRLNRQDAQNKLLATLQRDDPAHYGGGYVDQADGGTLVISSTDDGASDVAAASSEGYAGPIKVVKANLTYAALQKTAAAITTALGGDSVVNVELDVRNGGHLNVALSTDGISSPKQALRDSLTKVAGSYGNLVSIKPDERKFVPAGCYKSACSQPVRGGIVMGKNGYVLCTTGFMVLGTDFTWYMMTAGHCLTSAVPASSEVDYVDDSSHQQFRIGTTWHNYYFEHGQLDTYDVGIVKMDTALGVCECVLVDASNDPGKATAYNETYGVTDPPGPPSTYSYLCHTGYVGGTHCGQVQPLNGADHTTVNAVTCEGDSGGPWYANGHAYGITVLASPTKVPAPSPPSYFDGGGSDCRVAGGYLYIKTAESITNTHF